MPGDSPTGSAAGAGAHDLTARLTVGERVVVRHLLPEGAEAGATDVLGRLVSRDEEWLVIDGAFGRVRVPRRAVVAAKEVPPPPSRPGPAHRRVSADDLELVMAAGWVALEQGSLGAWLLRSAARPEGRFTGRANSALPVGDPTLPLDRAVDYVERWYAERGQPTLVQVPGPVGFQVADREVGAALLDRGYEPSDRVQVMTAPTAALPPLTEQSPPVVGDAQLQPEWLLAYGRSRCVVPGVTEQVLTGSRGQLFMSVRDRGSGQLVGIGRMAVHPGWAGIFGLWVDPDHRRRGIATAIVSAIAMAAQGNNMPSTYLQVSEHNEGGLALWESLGFERHHDYLYLSQPAG